MGPKIRIKGFKGEWTETKFASLAKIRRGLTYSPSNVTQKGIRVLRSSNIDEDTFVISDEDVFVEQACVNIPLVNDGDILITAANGSPRLVGKHAIVKTNGDYAVPGGFMVLAMSEEPLFLNTSMSSPWYKNFLKTGVAGGNGAIGNLNKKALEDSSFFIPADKEERNSLGSYFLHLDSLIQSTAKKIESLKQVKAASLQSMFPQSGEAAPRVRFKEYANKWKTCKLNSILTERHEASTITQELPQLSFTIADGVIRPEDRKSNQRDFLIKDKDNKRYLITRVGDIIYNPANVVYGAIHRNSLIDGVVSPIYRIFYTNQDSRFIECVVRRPSFINQLAMRTEGTVTKLKTLKPEAFLDMTVCIPTDIEEQKAIGEYFRNLDQQIILQAKRLDKLKQIKSACLDNMFV
jgi:type I restriction enzyme S subunit